MREEVHEVEGWNGKVRWSALLWRRNGGRGRGRYRGRRRGDTRKYLMEMEFVEDDDDDDDDI